MWDQMLLGIQTAFTLQNMLFAALGCFIGTIIGMLPGLGPMSVVAIMIPVSIQIGDPSTTLILLAGVYYGAIFGGSTSSILINAPGEAAVVATSFDGYPMARIPVQLRKTRLSDQIRNTWNLQRIMNGAKVLDF